MAAVVVFVAVVAAAAVLTAAALVWRLSNGVELLARRLISRRRGGDDEEASVPVLRRRDKIIAWAAGRVFVVVAAAAAGGWIAGRMALDVGQGATRGAVVGILTLAAGMACYRWRAALWAMAQIAAGRHQPAVDDRGLNRQQWEAARQRCFAKKGKLCHIGLRCCTGIATQVDHIVPLARGGPRYDLSNLQPSCGPCNRAKGTKPMNALWGCRPPAFNEKRRQQIIERIAVG